MKSLISFRHPVVIKRDQGGTEVYGVAIAVEGEWAEGGIGDDGVSAVVGFVYRGDLGPVLWEFVVEKMAYAYQGTSGLFAMINLGKPVSVYIDPNQLASEQLIE